MYIAQARVEYRNLKTFSPFAAKVDAIYVDSGLGNCRSFGRTPGATPDPTRPNELRGGRPFNVVSFVNFGKSLAHPSNGKKSRLLRIHFAEIAIKAWRCGLSDNSMGKIAMPNIVYFNKCTFFFSHIQYCLKRDSIIFQLYTWIKKEFIIKSKVKFIETALCWPRRLKLENPRHNQR